MEHLETLIAQVNSLQLKLSDGSKGPDDEELTSFLVQLMRGKEVTIPNGPSGAIGKRIENIFFDAQKVNTSLLKKGKEKKFIFTLK